MIRLDHRDIFIDRETINVKSWHGKVEKIKIPFVKEMVRNEMSHWKIISSAKYRKKIKNILYLHLK